MVLEDLHARAENAALEDVGFERLRRPDQRLWRCHIYTHDSVGYGEGVGPTMAEALEGALDDMERSTT